MLDTISISSDELSMVAYLFNRTLVSSVVWIHGLFYSVLYIVIELIFSALFSMVGEK